MHFLNYNVIDYNQKQIYHQFLSVFEGLFYLQLFPCQFFRLFLKNQPLNSLIVYTYLILLHYLCLPLAIFFPIQVYLQNFLYTIFLFALYFQACNTSAACQKHTHFLFFLIFPEFAFLLHYQHFAIRFHHIYLIQNFLDNSID